MSAGKMTADEFERLFRAFMKALKTYDRNELVETIKITIGDKEKFCTKVIPRRIPNGEWSIIKAMQEEKANGRIKTER